jgi:hypothetical protein
MEKVESPEGINGEEIFDFIDINNDELSKSVLNQEQEANAL